MDTARIPLSCLQAGQRGIVETIHLKGDIRRRMQEMGLIDGTEVLCLRHAPSGSPGAYQFRGATVALRKGDAQRIEVCPWD